MENNVKLDLKKKRNITKKIGDQSFKIKPFISIEEKEYILNQICKSLSERISEKENIVPLMLGVQADLDLLICAICTNVNMDNIDYETVYNSEFLTLVKDNIVNYKDIENTINNLMLFIRITSLLPDLKGGDFDLKKIMEGRNIEEIKAFTDSINNIKQLKE